MHGDGVVPGADFNEELGEMLQLGDEVVVYLLDVEEDILDCFDLLCLVELLEGKVHALRVVD